MFCLHNWKQIEKLKHIGYDYSGIEVLTAMCRCSKCGKKKERKFMGKVIGNLFW